MLLLIICSILLCLTSCNPYESGSSKGNLYSLSLVDGKVVSDSPYVFALEIDDEFSILNLADIQLSNHEAENRPELYNELKEEIAALIEESNPDLITLTGDQGYGERNIVSALSQILDSFGIPWAPVFGNHDSNAFEINLREQAEIYKRAEHSIFANGPTLARIYPTGEEAIGHYIINIVDIEGDSFTVVRTLIFMNSGDRSLYKDADKSEEPYPTGYSWAMLSKNQIAWYEDAVVTASKYSDEETVKSGIILHIPPYCYLHAASEAYKTEHSIFDIGKWMNTVGSISYADSYSPDVWNEGYKDSFGIMHEPYGGPVYNDHFFDTIERLGSTDFIIAGHEHMNNFSINYHGVRLTYGMKTGDAAYHEYGIDGGTNIRFTKDDLEISHILYSET